MRLLLLNANASPVVTAKVEAGARAAAAPGTEIVAVCADDGPRVIGTRAENALAARAAIELAARHAGDCDAVVIAVSYDTGLGGVRELLSIPVIGMTEAALLTACMLGGRIGIVTFGRRVVPMYRELVSSYGLDARIAGWRCIESNAPYQPGAHDQLDRMIVAEALSLVDVEGAETIVLTGAVMAGVPARLQPQVPVPMLDGVTAGVRQAELLVRARYPKPSSGSYALPGAREIVGLDPAVARAFGAPDPAS
jgi:allantoin racemase